MTMLDHNNSMSKQLIDTDFAKCSNCSSQLLRTVTDNNSLQTAKSILKTFLFFCLAQLKLTLHATTPLKSHHHSLRALYISDYYITIITWKNWPALELLHSSLTESVSLPNAVHLRLDTANSTDSYSTTQSHSAFTRSFTRPWHVHFLVLPTVHSTDNMLAF